MSALLVPDLDEALLAELRERARQHQRDEREEARAILIAALRPPSRRLTLPHLVAVGGPIADRTDG